MSEIVLYETAGGVATVTLNDPERRNALSAEMLDGLAAAIDRAAADPEVRCLVMASSHESVWCAGADLSGFKAETSLIEKHAASAGFMNLFQALSDFPKPTLGKIGGHALAGGMGLALCCDLLVASEEATFGTPEINVGAFPFMIMAVIYRNLPRKRANELLLLGDRISAQEALEMSLVNRVVPAGELDAFVDDWAAKLAAKSPLIMAMGKEAMARQRDLELEDALDYLRSQLSLAQSTEDIVEGVTAFFEKRDPVWKGR
ncbi:MAG: enoyl-CoA hydratase/isomerase family protein [Solirubrobacteraceae bacterium]|nr:enoyl-CoA hydratase/isomerase family protein [Solirubrobacteraceae bacterium]